MPQQIDRIPQPDEVIYFRRDLLTGGIWWNIIKWENEKLLVVKQPEKSGYYVSHTEPPDSPVIFIQSEDGKIDSIISRFPKYNKETKETDFEYNKFLFWD